jgi:cardiolipin synthase
MVGVVDDPLPRAVSANFDRRSLFLNYVLMIAFLAPADVRGFAVGSARAGRTASLYQARPAGLPRDLLEGMVLWVGFQL